MNKYEKSFPYIVTYFLLMLIAYGISASNIIITFFFPDWNYIPSTTIPYEVIGWFWTTIASIYCGGVALLEVFTSRNLQNLSGIQTSAVNLHKISMMNYFACLYCFAIKIIGVDIPLEAIISATGMCTIFIVLGKKGSQSVIQLEEYNSNEEELKDLHLELEKRLKSGEFKDKDNSGKDDKAEELEEKINSIQGSLLKKAEGFKK